MTYELDRAKYEYERNKAADEYFDARPHIECSQENEKLFEDGFRMAWELFTRIGANNESKS